MYKISICGHFGGDKEFFDGQTVKTKNVYKVLEGYYGNEQINKIDTHNWKKHPLRFLKQCIKAMKNSKNMIILPAHNGVRVFVPLFVLLKKIYKVRIVYIVIGGWLPEFIKTKKRLKKQLNKIDKILVETNNMKLNLEEQEITNVGILVNFKDMQPIGEDELNFKCRKPYKLCTFSRVMKEKGIEDIISVVNKLNCNGEKKDYELDIYGEISLDYKSRFENIINMSNSYIKYKGVAKAEKSVEIIKNYDLLIFPTYYEGEGMAGTLIDAMFSGVPVIASDWKYNNEIIKNGYNGYLYKPKDNVQLQKYIIKILSEKEQLIKMKKNCLVESHQYVPLNATNILTKELI